LCMCVGD